MNHRRHVGYGIEVSPRDRALGLCPRMAGHFHTVDHVCPERIRDDFILIYCVGGHGTLHLSDQRFAIRAGDIFVAPAGIRHAYRCDPEDGWEIWWVHFEGPVADHLVHGLGTSVSKPVISIGIQTGILRQFKALMRLLREKPPHAGLDAAATLFTIAAAMRKHIQTRAIEHVGVEAVLHGGFESVDAMAAAAGMSKFHFARSFRKVMGIAPWRYMIRRRMSRAQELLVESDLSIKQISYQLGFEDANYFSRLFAKEFGQSATAFRQRNRQER